MAFTSAFGLRGGTLPLRALAAVASALSHVTQIVPGGSRLCLRTLISGPRERTVVGLTTAMTAGMVCAKRSILLRVEWSEFAGVGDSARIPAGAGVHYSSIPTRSNGVAAARPVAFAHDTEVSSGAGRTARVRSRTAFSGARRAPGHWWGMALPGVARKPAARLI